MVPILHLSLPVADLVMAKRFYVDMLGCETGRENLTAVDVWFQGMQLTLQELPGQVLQEQGSRHFGATLEPAQFEAMCVHVEARGGTWLHGPVTRHEGTPHEERKAYLADPSGNVIELKAYADLGATLLSTDTTYA